MKSSEIEEILTKLLSKNPNPKIELNYCNDLTLLIAILLSAQTTDKIVNRATEGLFGICKTPQDFIKLGEENLRSYVKIVGLHQAKSRYIIKLCQILINDFNSLVPEKFEELVKLPGVGVKTANVYLANARNENRIGIDTHVFRVCNRLGITNAKTIPQSQKQLEEKIPMHYRRALNHLLVLHGRYVCKAKKPQCNSCEISSKCKFFNSN